MLEIFADEFILGTELVRKTRTFFKRFLFSPFYPSKYLLDKWLYFLSADRK